MIQVELCRNALREAQWKLGLIDELLDVIDQIPTDFDKVCPAALVALFRYPSDDLRKELDRLDRLLWDEHQSALAT